RDLDLHVHIPRARAAQDFAGMGAAIFAAVCSLLLDIACRADIAIVGELTLRGTVLPVRGVKDMILCAHRAGIRELVLPARNEPDAHEVPDDVLAELRLRYVHRVDELLPIILAPPEDGGAIPEGESPTPEVRV